MTIEQQEAPERSANGTIGHLALRSCCPTATSGASGRRCCRSCCGWRRCAGSRRVAVAAGARLHRRRRRAVHRAAAEARVPGRVSTYNCAGTRTKPLDRVRVPGHGADVRARRPVRGPAAATRDSAKIATALFQATVIALVFALANGEHFSSYYIFYGSLFFGDDLHRRAARAAHARSPAGCSSRPAITRRALLVGSGKHIEAVAHALSGRARTRVDDRRLHLADAAAAERPALARRARASCRTCSPPSGSRR